MTQRAELLGSKEGWAGLKWAWPKRGKGAEPEDERAGLKAARKI